MPVPTPALDRAAAQMAAAGVDALLLGPGADLRYLVGYRALPLERLTLLVARADGRHALLVPRLERPRAEDSGAGGAVAIQDFAETDDPFALAARCLDGLPPGAVLGAGDRLWSTFLLGLQDALPSASWVRASTVTRELRMRKAPDEVDALRRAGQAIDRVHAQVPGLLKAGRTESEVGRDIADAILAEGHQTVNFVIVGSGPNGASPHHETGSRVLADGDAIVVDIGGTLDGYCSDCTRDYVVGDPPDGYAEAHAALETAQAAACDAVHPGVTAAAIDARARRALRRRLRRALRPPHRPRHRPRGARGPLHRRRQRPRPCPRHGLLDRAGRLPARPVRHAHRGHRRRDRRRVRAAEHPRPGRGGRRAVTRRPVPCAP
jgi:Xaa-Pro aminopeptidase